MSSKTSPRKPSGRKRPRTSNDAPLPPPTSPSPRATTATRKRRPALGPPPDSLVRLLQTDSAVLKYFQSLQANLEADVQVWKDRARRWQEKYEQQCEVAKSTSFRVSQNGKRKSKEPQTSPIIGSSNRHNTSEEALVTTKPKKWTEKERTSRKPIQSTESLENSLDENHDEEDEERCLTSPNASAIGPGINSKEEAIDDALLQELMETSSSSSWSSGQMVKQDLKLPCIEQSNRTIEQYWEEALAFLRDEMGVESLQFQVTPREDESSSEPDVDAMNRSGAVLKRNPKEEPPAPLPCVPVRPTFINIEPHVLISEILSAIRALCRVQTIDPDLLWAYGPFDRDTLLPSVEGPEGSIVAALDDTQPLPTAPHPAVRAMRHLQRSILILTSLCPPTMRTGGVDARVQQSKLFQSWVLSLQGEIAEGWACHDRAEIWSNPALVLDETPTDTSYSKIDHVRDCRAAVSTNLNGDPSTAPHRLPFTGGPKSQNRLSSILERYWLARLVLETLLDQGQDDAAFSLVLDYVLSSLPTIQNGPKSPPVLSFVVLRGMLIPVAAPRDAKTGDGKSWLVSHLAGLDDENLEHPSKRLLQVLSLAFRCTAFLWNARLQSVDDRISDVARVELASYHDLVSMLGVSLSSIPDVIEGDTTASKWSILTESVRRLVLELTNEKLSSDASKLQSDAFQMALILNGDLEAAGLIIRQSLRDNELTECFSCRAVVAAQALRQLILRELDGLREQVGRLITESLSLPWSLGFQPHSTDSIPTLVNALDCAELLGDGQTAIQIMDQILCEGRSAEPEPRSRRRLCDLVLRACATPTVRIINLQRRPDRWNALRAQCLRENLFALLGVADVVEVPDSPCRYFGAYALDGGGRKAEVYERLARSVGGPSPLKLLVSAEWCPNDLKPFDKDAPSDEGLVQMTDSEIACALSHVATWKGALRSFQLSTGTDAAASETAIYRHPQYVRRLFHLGGFAEGPALLTRHAAMAPAPVCIVLEDDAVLVDRFRDRLSELLRELPRDFHFCALGYGRPKSAPVAPYSRHVGVPSHQFYLTGYLVSELGCRHLLQSLPVVGPVDAWIGLQQTRNWDNALGEALGVGSHARPPTTDSGAAGGPSRSDLSRILQFRAFCAAAPLCYQKVGPGAGVGAGESHELRNWRLRDTDIVYSGDQRRTKRDGEA